MKKTEKHIHVVIIGGGPVGLFLAISLLKRGIHCRVLEKRKDPVPDSRSLGIHPVSLELFDELGISTPFLEAGLKIKKGIALTENRKLGEISFESCPGPHKYILACPQFTTEKILRNELQKLDSEALITESTFEHFEEKDDEIITTYTNRRNESVQLTSSFIVGCDGKNSSVRQQASIHYSGKRYSDTYVMGDFEDTTKFGVDAAVFLAKAGLIECFPLPNGMRRWVIKTDQYIEEPDENLIKKLIQQRIQHTLYAAKSTMISSFGVQHFTAETFVKGRVILAGDAAHVVSPIGGQGMNLGWLGAQKISLALQAIASSSTDQDQVLESLNDYNRIQKNISKKVARRAELNMRLGRKTSVPILKEIIIRTMLSPLFSKKVARTFTMRGLENDFF
ncbi:FAD-dependent oxidoreductase [Gracilimonas sp.]|uniref:FAD-dependent oxidoreductase n=1 Tax=Gracilimonas sp. TaxID=1974203 RepID=UPI0028712E4D|nr:NAD(P)/FAD-dependent oxidoreductase [Gracilimonas sp.]